MTFSLVPTVLARFRIDPSRLTLAQEALLVRVMADVRPNGTCWTRTRGISTTGYGLIGMNGQRVGAHVLVYEILVGPVPEGLELDHLCHNGSGCRGGDRCPHRACVNPAHLEPVTNTENNRRGQSPPAINARKTRCKRGHRFDYVDPRGNRGCSTCVRLRYAAQREES